MRQVSGAVLFLLGIAVLVVVAGAAAVVVDVAGLAEEDARKGRAPTSSVTTARPGLAASQVAVTGTATTVTIEGAQIGELVLGGVTTPTAGLGSGARFEDVVVDGEPVTISWDAGRPLVMAASTPLRLGPAPVVLAASVEGVRVTLFDGGVYDVVAGEYQLDTPVAVTGSGLGQARDSVRFTAVDATTVVFSGGATADLPAGPVQATGPGHVVLEGDLELRRPDGVVAAVTRVELPTGSFRIAFEAAADGSGVALTEALLEGPVTAI